MENKVKKILNLTERTFEERIDLSLLKYVDSKPTEFKHVDFYDNLISLQTRKFLDLNSNFNYKNNFDAAISVFDKNVGKEKLLYVKITSAGKEYLNFLKKKK